MNKVVTLTFGDQGGQRLGFVDLALVVPMSA